MDRSKFKNRKRKKNYLSPNQNTIKDVKNHTTTKNERLKDVIIIIINRFRGEDILNSFIMAYRDEDSILDQIHKKQIYSAFYYEDLKFEE